MILRYEELLTNLRRGIRNGNWRRLSRTERAFYRASLCYARIRGRIVNQNITSMLSEILERLRETPKIRILKKGFERAKKLLESGSKIFELFPKLREWLKDITYLEWLGTV